MAFEIDSLHGYETGKRYEKTLTLVSTSGNSNTRYVTFKDEDGHELWWKTSDYTKVYQNLKDCATYIFTVDYILQNDPSIRITRLQLSK